MRRMRPHPERRRTSESAPGCRLHPWWRVGGAAPCVRRVGPARAAQETRAFVATANLRRNARSRQSPLLGLPTTPCRTSPLSSARQTTPSGVDPYCGSGEPEPLVDAVPRARVLGSRDALRSGPEHATMTRDHDRRRVLRLCHVDILYAAVIATFIKWQTAIIEAFIRVASSDPTPPCLRAHVCVRSTPAAGPSTRAPPQGLQGNPAGPRVRAAVSNRRSQPKESWFMDMQFFWALGLILGFFLLWLAVTADTQALAKQINQLVRRAKAPFLSGCESRPATVAPAGSSQSGRWR